MTRSSKIRALSLAAAFVAATGALMFGQSKKGYYTPSPLGSLPQSAPVRLESDSNFAVSSYPAPAPDLTPGEGLAEVRIYCNTCHSPRYITMQPPLPAATWEAEVGKMNKAFGAAIPEDSSRKIVSYLQAHYTMDTRR
jgi:hypothetical protein